MKCFSAVSINAHHAGGWQDVLHWSQQQISGGIDYVKIFVARGGERHWRLAAEVTPEGVRVIQNGRIVTLRGMRKWQKRRN